jgi:hypothetical protein
MYFRPLRLVLVLGESRVVVVETSGQPGWGEHTRKSSMHNGGGGGRATDGNDRGGRKQHDA